MSRRSKRINGRIQVAEITSSTNTVGSGETWDSAATVLTNDQFEEDTNSPSGETPEVKHESAEKSGESEESEEELEEEGGSESDKENEGTGSSGEEEEEEDTAPTEVTFKESKAQYLELVDDMKRCRKNNKKRKLLPTSVLAAISTATPSILTEKEPDEMECSEQFDDEIEDEKPLPRIKAVSLKSLHSSDYLTEKNVEQENEAPPKRSKFIKVKLGPAANFVVKS